MGTRARSAFVAVAASAVAICTAVPAVADSVVYVRGHNLWIASPDGAQQRQLTTSGSAEQRWDSPSSADSGMVLGVWGSGTNKFFEHMKPDGTVVHRNLAPMSNCGMPPIGPLAARMSHDGAYVAYGYFCNSGYSGGFAADPRVALAFPDRYTASGNQTDWSDRLNPTWFGSRLVATERSGDFAYIQPATGPGELRAPFTTQWDAFLKAAPNEDLQRVEFNRAGDRLIVEYRLDGVGEVTDIIEWLPPVGPGGNVGQVCRFAANGEASDVTWSPDGTRVAWKDASGVRVSPPISVSTPGCYSGVPALIAADGDSPVFGRPDVPAVPPPGGPLGGTSTGTGTGTGTGTAATDTIPPSGTLSVRRGLRLVNVLRSGLPLSVSCSEACSIQAQATLARTLARRLGVVASARKPVVVARATQRLAKAGKTTIKLKFNARARRALQRRPRALRLAVRLTRTDAAGNRKVTRRTVKVRR